MHLTPEQAGEFYAVHKERPFYQDLVSYMSLGPGHGASARGATTRFKRNRDIMGATNPAEAEPGTIRADFAESIDANTVHGSDAPETAAVEIDFFFPDGVCPRS